jgi:hypothetical protein
MKPRRSPARARRWDRLGGAVRAVDEVALAVADAQVRKRVLPALPPPVGTVRKGPATTASSSDRRATREPAGAVKASACYRDRAGQITNCRTLSCSAHPGRPLATTMVRITATGSAPVRAARLPARISESPDLIPSGWCWARWPRISTASCCGTTPGWSSATTKKLPSGSSLFPEKGESQRFRRSRETSRENRPGRHSGAQPDGDRNETEFGS